MKIRNKITNTFPVVFHGSGVASGRLTFNIIKKKLFLTEKKDFGSKNIQVVTFNTTIKKGCFETSCDHLGIPYLVLGEKGKKWEHMDKIYLLDEILDFVDKKYILICDDFDSIMVDDPENSIKDFKSYGCKVVYSAEICNYPFIEDSIEDELYPEKIFRYLCAGSTFGEVEFLRKINKYYIDILKSNNEKELIKSLGNPFFSQCDQFFLRRNCFGFFPDVQLDVDCFVIQNLAGINDSENDYFFDMEFV